MTWEQLNIYMGKYTPNMLYIKFNINLYTKISIHKQKLYKLGHSPKSSNKTYKYLEENIEYLCNLGVDKDFLGCRT